MSDAKEHFFLYISKHTPAESLSVMLQLRFSFIVTVQECDNEPLTHFQVLLPDGWTVEEQRGRRIIRDAAVRLRIVVSPYDELEILRRYYFHVHEITSGFTGEIHDQLSSSLLGRVSSHRTEDEISDKCTAWLDGNYPQWRDPLAYWPSS